ncbi:cytochrome P450 monooxygenase [Xylaria acuta]|nr:cytochrome P450 monooxygenase [Xylaria acuta]
MNETFLSNFGFSSLENGRSPRALLSVHPAPYVLAIVLVLSTTYAWATSNPSLKKLPYVNPSNLFSNAQAKREYRYSAKTILQKARKQYPNQPYRMTTEYGEVVMLQSEWFNEIRNLPGLSFFGTFSQERICEIPGFEPLAALGSSGKLVQIIARKQLTKLLAQVTAPLSEEIAHAVTINLGQSTGQRPIIIHNFHRTKLIFEEWREITIAHALLDITARMSSRIFLGEELARDEEWLRITKNYTVDAVGAVIVLSKYPVNLRPYIGWLFPECRRVKDYYKRTRNVINPILKKRQDMKQAALAAGQPAPVFNDALEWIEQESKELNSGYDAVIFQLILSTVAISTTADLLQSVLVDLIQHPESMQAVRHEIVHVLGQEGWKKSSLYNLKLLDSVIKETQRIRPLFTAMRRAVEADTVLSDGTVVKKGSRVHIDTHRMEDPEVYENPEVWKGDRFLELRSQPGKEHLAQLVTTSVDHFGFGHGEHACPGRFFAANEIKITLCHLLMKYDWELAPETDTNAVRIGFSQRANAATKVLYRKRQTAELDVDLI